MNSFQQMNAAIHSRGLLGFALETGLFLLGVADSSRCRSAQQKAMCMRRFHGSYFTRFFSGGIVNRIQPLTNRGNMQREIACLAALESPTLPAPNELIAAKDNLAQAVALAIQLSRLADETIAARLHIDKGHFSRIMRGSAHFPIRKLPALMELTGSLAPLQWLAERMGYLLTPKPAQTRIAELEAEIAQLRKAA